ncbi:Aste57867_20147 [Aphanomyces stellatus]|uniref:Aste57867_20147 protein n=1 Tax=Aphanomyces stellatus TaxID=120398 RepID=A0A485LEG8_9STRA|nr:hypothetical protein As57867_020081 [Aphanomyces stellatus]VFT96842.1 Aste57867_20147 [Aphanomyces stellatus]
MTGSEDDNMFSLLSEPMESDQLREFASSVDKEELEALRRDIAELEKEFLLKQVDFQFISDLCVPSSPESLDFHLANVDAEESSAMMQKRKKQLLAACKERDNAVQQIEETLQQIDATRDALRQAEVDAKTMDAGNAKLREEWKQQQKRNTQKRTVLEMAFNVQISSEQSCANLLDDQAIAMQEDHEKERLLEDTLLDLTAQVKRADEQLKTLRQDATRQAGDEKVIEQAKKYDHLLDMMNWYEEMQALMENISGLRLLHVNDTLFEVGVADYTLRMHMDPTTLKLQSVQISPDTLDIDDLMEIALEENDVTFLLRETRMRAANMAQLAAHLDLLTKESVTCARQGNLIHMTFGAPDEEVHVQVEVSSEYAQDHEWLQLHAIKPANDRILDTLNTKVQCRNLVELIQEIVRQLLP